MSHLLDVQKLNIFYGGIHAVKDISFHVDQGEIVSLIGANGAGKTTTLKAISNLIKSSGKVFFQSEDINNLAAHLIVRKGLVHSPEGRGVFPNLTVLENLEMGAFIRTDKKKIKDDIELRLELFPRLRERLHQLAGTLSGGEQQMLAISRALMTEPKLLMLDEPSLGLAPKIVNQIFEIIVKLNSQGITVLLVEQNAYMALKISHRAYVLETGQIKMQGLGKELISNDEVRKSYLGV